MQARDRQIAAQREHREALARRQLMNAERELRGEGPDAQHENEQFLNTVTLVTQHHVAAVHVPLDFAQPIPTPQEHTLLRVLLHTNKCGGDSPPTLLNMQWKLPGSGMKAEVTHEIATQVVLRGISEHCWVADVPVPDAFLEPQLLAQPQVEEDMFHDQPNEGDEAGEDPERIEDDHEAIEEKAQDS